KAPKPVIPTIDWIGNNNTLIWKLLNEIEKKQNCSVLYGSKKVLRDNKIKVYKCIGEDILPEWYALDPDVIGNRMKNKAEVYTVTMHATKRRLRGYSKLEAG
ncbi:hypothetical protein K443DRAFT_635638, partial [Laccaria amethystina LaAM-08-1]